MSGQINLTNRLSRRFDPGDPTATGSGRESVLMCKKILANFSHYGFFLRGCPQMVYINLDFQVLIGISPT